MRIFFLKKNENIDSAYILDILEYTAGDITKRDADKFRAIMQGSATPH